MLIIFIIISVTLLLSLIVYTYMSKRITKAIKKENRIKDRINAKKSGIKEIDKMDGRQFELYLSHLFEEQGYSCIVTRSAGDYGADLIIKKDNLTIAVQAKRHAKRIGIDAIQQVHSSMNYYNANESWVITNNYYTYAATELAKKNKVKLINRKALIEMLLIMSPNIINIQKEILENEKSPIKECERCGKTMVLRKGPKGEFFGCSSYPKCRNIIAI